MTATALGQTAGTLSDGAIHHIPAWIRRPYGATFGFGGRLVSFSSLNRDVQVVTAQTEPGFVQRVVAMEWAFDTEDFSAYGAMCAKRATNTSPYTSTSTTISTTAATMRMEDPETATWVMLRVMFRADPREKLTS